MLVWFLLLGTFCALLILHFRAITFENCCWNFMHGLFKPCFSVCWSLCWSASYQWHWRFCWCQMPICYLPLISNHLFLIGGLSLGGPDFHSSSVPSSRVGWYLYCWAFHSCGHCLFLFPSSLWTLLRTGGAFCSRSLSRPLCMGYTSTFNCPVSTNVWFICLFQKFPPLNLHPLVAGWPC